LNETSIFSIGCSSNTQISCKSAHWEPSCPIRTERQTDDEVNSRFAQFYEHA
jgi:hypothetical protein